MAYSHNFAGLKLNPQTEAMMAGTADPATNGQYGIGVTGHVGGNGLHGPDTLNGPITVSHVQLFVMVDC